MCATVLLSFLKINTGRKRGFRQKDLAGLSTPTKQKSWQDKSSDRFNGKLDKTKRFLFNFFIWLTKLQTCLQSTKLKTSVKMKPEVPAWLQRVKIYKNLNIMRFFWPDTICGGEFYGERQMTFTFSSAKASQQTVQDTLWLSPSDSAVSC